MQKDQAVYLTQEGYEKLQKELTYLKDEKRVEIAEKLKEAISYGDLSENSEYEDARNEQAQVEVRIAEVDKQLKHAQIINEDKKGSKKINMGMTVTFFENTTKEEHSYKIVGTTEANILGNPATISNESLVGKTILGRKKGDHFSVKNGSGESVEYTISNVE